MFTKVNVLLFGKDDSLPYPWQVNRGGPAYIRGVIDHVLDTALKGGNWFDSTSRLSLLMVHKFLQFGRQFSKIMSRTKVYFDMTVGGQSAGRIVMEVCAIVSKQQLFFEAIIIANVCN